MISSFMQYGGISAKVRAMYGKRLTRSDYEKLIHSKSVSDIASYLKSLPAWSEALKNVQPTTVHRADLEKALRDGIDREYERIYGFMSGSDHPLMRFLIRRKEMDEIFRFIRLLSSPESASEYICTFPLFFKKHSGIRFEKFSSCRSFEDFLECLKGSIYYSSLSALPRKQGELPDYTITKAALSAGYFGEIIKLIGKKYSGSISKTLKEGAGTQVDLINIETIIRIKRFFPDMSSDLPRYLIPYGYKLKSDLVKSLTDANTADETLELLKSSPYAKLFNSRAYANLEDYRYQYLYDFYKKLLSSSEPSVFTPIAYLNIKEIEVNNIINIVECVRYGETPSSASISITGM
jgi:vacuolar-type H+-ATPase subunit C/Vma6